MTGDDLLGAAAGELYSADPEDFTRRRGELAAAARAAGQPAAARQIAALRKPTRSAWLINRLVRSDPGAATRLAGLGEQLRAAERSGDGSRLPELARARRQLIATLVPQALAVSGQHPPPAALREEVTATFSAALADPEVAEQIRQARLLRPARRAGFGAAQAPALALVAPLPGTRPGDRRERQPTRARTTSGPPVASPAADAPQAGPGPGRRRAASRAGPAPAATGRGRRPAAEPGRQARAGAKAQQVGADTEAGRARVRADTEAGRARVRADTKARRARVRADTEAGRARVRADTEAGRARVRADAKARRARAEAEAERARAEAEAERARTRRRARAEAEQALAAAEQAVQAARQAQQDQEEAVRRLEQQLNDVRRGLQEARAAARQSEITRRRARQVLGRLPE